MLNSWPSKSVNLFEGTCTLISIRFVGISILSGFPSYMIKLRIFLLKIGKFIFIYGTPSQWPMELIPHPLFLPSTREFMYLMEKRNKREVKVFWSLSVYLKWFRDTGGDYPNVTFMILDNCCHWLFKTMANRSTFVLEILLS